MKSTTKDRVIKKLKKYGWENHEGWSWDYGYIFEKRIKMNEYFIVLIRVETNPNGLVITTPNGWQEWNPMITTEELQLFKKLVDYGKEQVEFNERWKDYEKHK